MSDLVGFFRSLAPYVLALCAVLGAGCNGAANDGGVGVGAAPDAGDTGDDDMEMSGPSSRCDVVTIDGDVVTEHEEHFTARYRIGERYTKTVLLFGGEPVEGSDTLSNAYILGLDKEDALALAQQFPDFYLCSSPGGDAAAEHVFPYDFVPSTCAVYEELIGALDEFKAHHRAGGDRTSIRFDGAPLELISVIDNASGVDVSDQVETHDFHFITSVERLTAESVLDFGTTE